jgi:hypothetical protein
LLTAGFSAWSFLQNSPAQTEQSRRQFYVDEKTYVRQGQSSRLSTNSQISREIAKISQRGSWSS